MARVAAKLWTKGVLQLLHFLQSLITAATGNANAPTPNPHIATLQGLLDDGTTKNNAYLTAQAQCAAALQARDEQVQAIIDGLTTYIAAMEGHTGRDPVKLASLGLPLRGAPTTPLPCDTVTGLITSVGDDEGALSGAWDNQTQADTFEVQVSPDPITPTSWVHAKSVSRPRVKLTGQPSGQKRWLRVRAVNASGEGAWSDPSCRIIP